MNNTLSTQEQESIDMAGVPTHVAIIPDGNRRWAKKHLVSAKQGHTAGADNVVEIVRAAKELGIKALTIFAFSTENWNRSKLEVEHLMQIIENYLANYQEKLLSYNIRLRIIGNLQKLTPTLSKLVQETTSLTAHCSDFDLVLAINYGGRDEICRAMKMMARDLLEKKISLEEVSEERLSTYLDTHHLPDLDLLIRTSGEKRISNFLLWQSSYAEVYIDEVAWPDFTPTHLLAAVRDYQLRERRKGGGGAA